MIPVSFVREVKAHGCFLHFDAMLQAVNECEATTREQLMLLVHNAQSILSNKIK